MRTRPRRYCSVVVVRIVVEKVQASDVPIVMSGIGTVVRSLTAEARYVQEAESVSALFRTWMQCRFPILLPSLSARPKTATPPAQSDRPKS